MSDLITQLNVYYPAHHDETLLTVVDNSSLYNTPDFAILSRNNWRLFREHRSIQKRFKQEIGCVPYDLAKLEVRCALGTHKEILLQTFAQTLFEAMEQAAPIMQDSIIGPILVKEKNFDFIQYRNF